MKKLMIFMLVLGLASRAWATPYFEISGPLPIQDHYYPSEWIEISLMDNDQVDAFSIDGIVDVLCPGGGGAGGYADEPQTMAPFSYQQFGMLNYDGKLSTFVAGNTTEPPQTGKLYSFMYHVPDVPFSTLICIETYTNDNEGYTLPVVMYRDGTRYTGSIEMDACIHVIPEPATILLLAFGGLPLLRKRRK